MILSKLCWHRKLASSFKSACSPANILIIWPEILLHWMCFRYTKMIIVVLLEYNYQRCLQKILVTATSYIFHKVFKYLYTTYRYLSQIFLPHTWTAKLLLVYNLFLHFRSFYQNIECVHINKPALFYNFLVTDV